MGLGANQLSILYRDETYLVYFIQDEVASFQFSTEMRLSNPKLVKAIRDAIFQFSTEMRQAGGKGLEDAEEGDFQFSTEMRPANLQFSSRRPS